MQNHLSKPKDLMLQNATSQESLMNMSLVLRLPREIHLSRSSANVPRLPSFLEMPQNPHVLLTFGRVQNPGRLPHETTLRRPKVARTCGDLYMLTSKRALRHNGVHFFDISTSKSGPTLRCLVHFDFETCFAPQRRALFQHLNFLRPVSFWHFWLRHVLRAAKACTFSTSQLPKVNRAWCALCILTWKCASRLNGVHFFISHLARWLCTRRFSEPTFRPSVRSHKSLQKHSESRLFYFFTHLHLLSSDSFSSLIFFLLLFLSLTLPTSAFPSGHMVGSLTSKLPSTI